ncbi:MAG: type II toxin-antitoxin system HicA family toxin [Oscillospiraceae bacterium]|nr:type II toxin-antitoxin system HicA family toxin [Oscillospiraceae bacterium]
MSKKDKLLHRLLAKPKDFTYDELKSLLHYYGYEEDTSTSGSSVCFRRKTDNKIIMSMHKPHSPNTLKLYQVNDVINILEEEDVIK